MAKRTRGTSRPGQRRPTQRPTTRPTSTPAAVRRSGSLTKEEEARAAELEAQIKAEERAVEAADRQARDRARQAAIIGVRGESVPLAIKASGEYAYVRRDIHRILRIAAVLLLLLAVLHVLINVTGTISV